MERLTVIFLLAGTVISLTGQNTDTLPPSETSRAFIRKSSLVVLPIAFYTPETRLGGGGAAVYSFRWRDQADSTRPSQVQFGFAYTQERQVLLYLPYQLILGNDEWRAYGELGYYRYFYQFFGIGNQTREADLETYTAIYPRLRFYGLRQLAPSVFAGISYWFDDYDITERDSDGSLVRNEITGSAGGIISALGLVGNYDSRDYLFFPTQGSLVEILLLFNRQELGANVNYTRLSLDASKYFPVFRKHILAFNVFLQSHAGNPPFQQLAFIGGPRKMRGFFEGRYRDRHLWMLQAEYRMPLFRRLGAVVFAGTGSVAPAITDLTVAKVHYSYGAGLRVMLSRKDRINVRLDLGIDEEFNLLPYITVGEAF